MYDSHRKQSGVFRAALASAGAHEKAPRRKVQTLLHPKCPQIVVRTAGNRRLHLGSLLKMQSGRLEQLTAADALSASESRNAPSPRLSRPRHRNTQSAPFRTRQSLQHRVPQQHPAKCEQKETKVKESSHRKTVAVFFYYELNFVAIHSEIASKSLQVSSARFTLFQTVCILASITCEICPGFMPILSRHIVWSKGTRICPFSLS